MDTTYSLEPGYSYPLWPVIILILLVIALIYMLVKYAKASGPVVAQEFISPDEAKKKSLIKEYSGLINKVSKERKAGTIGERECYARLSLHVRRFVSEMTGENLQSYTFDDIKALNNQELTGLIGSYYGPEFGLEQLDDETMQRNLEHTVDKTLKLIKKWK